MKKYIDLPKFVFSMMTVLLLIFGMGSHQTAEASSCGGKNQKACSVLKKGPQCGSWLYKGKGKICRPCGGKGQRSCPVLKKGKVCKPGLKKYKGKCIAKPRARPCGGLNQKACPAIKKGPQCGSWLYKAKGKICRPCGGLNQKSCPVLKKGKVCKSGLKKKHGKCVKSDKASPRLIKQVNQVVSKNAAKIKVMHSIAKCVNKKSRRKALKKAYKRRDSAAAQRIVNQCVSSKQKRQLSGAAVGVNTRSRAPRSASSSSSSSDAKKFKSLSVGVGGGFILGAGVSGDAGVAISLNSGGVRFYSNREFAYGVGASVGADVIVGLSRQNLQKGEDKGRAVAAAGKYLAGGGVSVDFSGHAFPNFRNFDGFTVSGGGGVGAEIGTIYKSTATVY